MIYVSTTDRFMSGWGRAEGLINRLIFLCETSEDAEAVFNNATARDDQKHITCSSLPPKMFHKNWRETGADYESGRHYVQIKTKEEMPAWYKPGAF